MTFSVEHPSHYLPKALAHKLRNRAPEAERLGRLHKDQLAVIYEQQWFNMLVPKEYGGLALPLPTVLQTQEALSYADGSVGWVVTLCSGAGWFAGFLDQALATAVFKNPNVCIAGSGATTGTADVLENGYEINGFWKYASGALHATAFTANCLVRKAGVPCYHADGTPVVRTFLFQKKEVTVPKTWNAMGMIATGSHAFEVQKLVVPQNRCFTIAASKATHSNPLYQYSFLQLAETTLAVNISGMAARFIDLCHLKGTQKDNSHSNKTSKLLQQTAAAQDQLNALRETFYANARASWETLIARGSIDPTLLAAVSITSQRLVREARTFVNELFPYYGLEAADRGSEINRVWRNIHTAGQHALFDPSMG